MLIRHICDTQNLPEPAADRRTSLIISLSSKDSLRLVVEPFTNSKGADHDAGRFCPGYRVRALERADIYHLSIPRLT